MRSGSEFQFFFFVWGGVGHWRSQVFKTGLWPLYKKGGKRSKLDQWQQTCRNLQWTSKSDLSKVYPPLIN